MQGLGPLRSACKVLLTELTIPRLRYYGRPHGPGKSSVLREALVTQYMSYWMVKQEPESYAWADLVAEGVTGWTGVRNFQARNNLRNMGAGDRVLFYHSGKEKAVVGIAEVTRGAYPDPTSDDERWVAVDIKAVEPLPRPVTLATMRERNDLANVPLLRQTQLSVMPLTRKEFDAIVKLGSGRGPSGRG